MTNIQAGTLRTRATFYRRTTSTGSRGQLADSYTELGPRSVQIKWLSGSEVEQARQIFSTASVEVTMRKPREFTLVARDQMRIGTDRFGIGAVLPSDEEFNDIRLVCEVLQ